MSSRADDLAIHQLLGRLVYFHCLFIEPALPHPAAPREPGAQCCNHASPAKLPTVGELLRTTAWVAVVDIADSLPERKHQCPDRSDDCCITCTVVGSGGAIAEIWATTEHAAYRRPQPRTTVLREWRQAASSRLGTAFAFQNNTACRTLDGINAASGDQPALPSVQELPLLGELLGLWADPANLSRRPVASWLNHCTGLDDIRAVSQMRKDGT